MYFPNIFRYFDFAEHAYLRSLGMLVYDRAQGGWPRVNVSCDFKKPLLTADRVEVQIDIIRVGVASLTWAFEVIKDGEIAAKGSVTTVRVDHEGRPKEISAEERVALGFPANY